MGQKPILFTGNSNPSLAKDVAQLLKTEVSPANVTTFNDGETRVQVQKTVRGQKAFILQSTCAPVNNNLMELLLMADALRRSSAEKIIAVMPYYGYGRQDYQMAPREPISARVVADLLQAVGVTNVVSVDIHSAKAQGFFGIPFDNLSTTRLASDFLKKTLSFKSDDFVVVSPDAGGVKRAQDFVQRLNAPLAIIHKRRPKPGQVKVTHVVGDVEGKMCIMVDDMVDTGGSLLNGAQALLDAGAKSVSAYATHAVLSGDAVSKIEDSDALDRLFVTDTIPVKKSKKIAVCPIAPTLAKVIDAIQNSSSISPYVD
ncbi:ribose-phosphate pyrophosphokinase [Candidatus Micrarchaeota archaeon]|nr:ribose-phosphate pyrophosphokinase [Candidatus Micrarchaeota archaeon]